MNDIIKMAREAGFVVDEKAQQHQPNCIFHTYHMIDEPLERFAALVRADEREACAKVCEENGKAPDDHKAYEGYEEGYQDGSNNCAAAIRSRT